MKGMIENRLQPLFMDFSALFAGLVMIPAFAPFSQPAFMVLSLFFLIIILLNSASGWQFFRRGWLFGLGFYGAALHWMFVVANYVPESFAPVILLIHVGIILILCFFPALTSLLIYPLRVIGVWAVLAVFPFVWILMEWPRAWLWTGLPIYQLSHAFIDTPLAGFAPIGGELAMTLAVAAVAAGCAGVVVLPGLRQKTVAIICVISVWGLGMLADKMEWTTGGENVSVRLLHGEPDQQRKFKRYYATDTIDEYIARSTEEPRPDLVVWPESSVAGNLADFAGQISKGMKNLTGQGTSVLLGAYVHDQGKSYNALVSANDYSIQYFKRHLIPFGEYTPDWPLINLKEWLPGTDNNTLTAGTEAQPVLKMGKIAASPLICYEILFPDELRQTSIGANSMVFVADLFWFQDTWGIDQIFELARLRAKESGKPMFNATSYGITAIIDGKGQVVNKVDGDKPTKWIDGRVMLMEGVTPYTRFGNSILLLLALSVLLWAYVKCVVSARRSKFSVQQVLGEE